MLLLKGGWLLGAQSAAPDAEKPLRIRKMRGIGRASDSFCTAVRQSTVGGGIQRSVSARGMVSSACMRSVSTAISAIPPAPVVFGPRASPWRWSEPAQPHDQLRDSAGGVGPNGSPDLRQREQRRASCVRILLVEDNRGDADLVRMAFAEAKADVELVHVERLSEALAAAAEGGFDLALLDLSLPDAFELSGLGRLHMAFPSLPIVVLTSLHDERLAAKAVAEGAQDYLVKGDIPARLLVRAVRYAIERHQYADRARLLAEAHAARVAAEALAGENARLYQEAQRAITQQERLVTEAEEAQAKAQAAETEAKLIGAQQERLVAIVSHDLRNPLNAITVTAQHLQMDASEHQARGLSRIVTSARRMQSMIHDLLDFARVRHGAGIPVQLQPARLGDVCRHALEEIRSAQRNGNVLLHVTGDDSATLDPARVEQVVCNLVSNALKHGATDAPVNVHVSEDGAGVRLEVTNQGTPIPQHLVATLFDPFRPGDAPGSVGLGLFIVSEVARAHGGSVSVSSGEQGTTFTVAFPRPLSAPESVSKLR
jgi:phosphoserine phosphatase RsbU/P